MQITPHPNPLPASGERGFDGLIFCNKYKIEEEIRSIFFIPTRNIRESFLIYFLKKIVAVIPSPRKRGEG